MNLISFYVFTLIFISDIYCKQLRYFPNSILELPGKNESLKLNIEEDEVSFYMISDWGGIPHFPYRTFVQQMISRQMERLAKDNKIHFTMALGDNFYYDGVTDVHDSRFRKTYEDVFSPKYLDMPWLIQLGNHDYLGNCSAQLDYTNYSNRWILPDYFYSVDVNVSKKQKKLIHIMMIDTQLLCGISDYPDSFDKKLSGREKILSDLYFKKIEEELKNLAEENVPYIIIAGHYPVWSVSMHGPTYLLVDKLRPLLFKYKVNAYFSGHDHDLQHFSENKNDVNVHYILNGAADIVKNNRDHINSVPNDSLKFYWSNTMNIHGAICLIRANSEAMIIEYIETSGKQLHKIIIPNQFKR